MSNALKIRNHRRVDPLPMGAFQCGGCLRKYIGKRHWVVRDVYICPACVRLAQADGFIPEEVR